jgi:hypothetical protein
MENASLKEVHVTIFRVDDLVQLCTSQHQVGAFVPSSPVERYGTDSTKGNPR